MFHAWFELAGFSAEEIEAQMSFFAENCLPELRRLCGGRPPLREAFRPPTYSDVRPPDA